ncbi:hypothetical protein MMC22_001122 [Lobaria immixta]|nr:hypothetical protein [Lobaria immixta]
MGIYDASPYHALGDEESADEKRENSSEEPLLPAIRARIQHVRSLKPQFSCNVTASLLILCAFVSTILATVVTTRWLETRNNGLIKATSFYSPIFNRLDIPLITRQNDATLFYNESNPSHIYRLPPSPEVDAAWERIANIGIHPVTREDVIRLGKNPDEAIIPPDYWGLDGHYMVELDVFHQIHCLNALRQALVFNYDYYWGERFGLNPPLMFTTHLNHCTSMILQTLQCHADLDAITYRWRHGQDKPFPDFGTNKKCRDFDAILAWQEKVQMPDRDGKWDRIVKPTDAVQLPVTPGLYDLGEGTGEVDGIPTSPLPGLQGSLGNCRG